MSFELSRINLLEIEGAWLSPLLLLIRYFCDSLMAEEVVVVKRNELYPKKATVKGRLRRVHFRFHLRSESVS